MDSDFFFNTDIPVAFRIAAETFQKQNSRGTDNRSFENSYEHSRNDNATRDRYTAGESKINFESRGKIK